MDTGMAQALLSGIYSLEGETDEAIRDETWSAGPLIDTRDKGSLGA